jgi:hypothetical protein
MNLAKHSPDAEVIITPPPVKTFDAGICDSDGYGSLSGFQTTDGIIQLKETVDDVPASRRRRVIIVGAGICGVQQASILLRDGNIKLQDIQMFDAMDDFGGVWRKNTYPGCACDVPAMIYTTSYNIWRSETVLAQTLSIPILFIILTFNRLRLTANPCQSTRASTQPDHKSRSTIPTSHTRTSSNSVSNSTPSSNRVSGMSGAWSGL